MTDQPRTDLDGRAHAPTTPSVRPLTLDGSWAIGNKIHGGYLLVQVVEAALQELPHPDPVAVSAHFLAAPDPGEAAAEVEVLRVGRQVSTASVGLTQGGRRMVSVLVSAGNLPEQLEPLWSSPGDDAPEMAPLEVCHEARAEVTPGFRIGPLDHVDMRIDPSTAGYLSGRPARRGIIQAWLRPKGGRPADPLWLLIAGDALPPVTFDLGLSGWVPTVSFDMHLRCRPAGGWLRAVQTARRVAGGWLDETCDVWDERGELVGVARQLAMYRSR